MTAWALDMQLWAQVATKDRLLLFLPSARFTLRIHLLVSSPSMTIWTLTPRLLAAIRLFATLLMSNRYIAIRICPPAGTDLMALLKSVMIAYRFFFEAFGLLKVMWSPGAQEAFGPAAFLAALAFFAALAAADLAAFALAAALASG